MVGAIFVIIIAYIVWCGVAATDRKTGGIKDYNRFFCTSCGMSKRQIQRNIRKGRW